MIMVAGKMVYTTLDELVMPAHTALVVVDMQHDFCAPGGAFDALGIDLSMYPPMIPRLARLVAGARAAGVAVVFIQMTVLAEGRSESPAQLRFNMRLHMQAHAPGAPLHYALDGSRGHAIIPDLAPEPGDLVVRKYRSSGFWGTNLQLLLRSNQIQTVVMTGCTTEGCVESTARDALFNDLYVVVPEDCVASDDPRQHEASLLLMRHRFDVVSSAEVLAVWNPRGSPVREGARRGERGETDG
ncbi:MAG: cysteine hydrolase [Chloroflexota bacterium]